MWGGKKNIGYGGYARLVRGIDNAYEGETVRAARLVGASHLRGFDNKELKNALFKLNKCDHQNEKNRLNCY